MTLQVTCPHCGKTCASGEFCESCGKALPSASGGPRIVTGNALPTSAAGQKLVGDELKKQMRRAANTLLAVGIIQAVVGAILLAVLNSEGASLNELNVLLIAQFVVAAGFLGLSFWARRAPLPAAIVGFVIYTTLVVINVVTTLSQVGQGNRRGIGGLGIGWLDIVIIVFLVQGIQAGLKYKRMMESPVE